jgi:hypothetical protein
MISSYRLNNNRRTELHGRVRSIPASYSGSPALKYRPGDRFSWLRVSVDFLRFSRQMPKYYLKLGQEGFLTRPFQLIRHPTILRINVAWATDDKGKAVPVLN